MQNALDHVTLLNPSKEAEGVLDIREGGGGRWRNAFKTMKVSCAPDLVPRNAKQGHETSQDAPISKQHFPLRWARDTVRMLLDQGVKPVDEVLCDRSVSKKVLHRFTSATMARRRDGHIE